MQPLKEALGDEDYAKLELIEADILEEANMIEAIKGSTFVVHMASPFVFTSNTENLVEPVEAGIKSLMKACKEHKVKRCVMTSDIAAIQNVAEDDKPEDNTFDETIWSNPDRSESLDNYLKAKIKAEKTAWDF